MPREGYSENSVAELSSIQGANIFCLPNDELFICNGYRFLSWSSQRQKFSEVKLEIDFTESDSSNEIVKVANSNLFILIHTVVYPEHNDFEKISVMLFQGKSKVCDIPVKLKFPSLNAENSLLGINSANELVEYHLETRVLRSIYKFNEEIIGLYIVGNNQLIVTDESCRLTLYQLNDDKFEKTSVVENVRNIEAIQAIDADEFVCSIFDNLGDPMSRIKNGVTKIQVWDKVSLSCTKEIEMPGVIINELRLMPGSISNQILIGSYQNDKNIFIISLTEKNIKTIDMGGDVIDYNIAADGKISALVDSADVVHLFQLDAGLVDKLYYQNVEGTVQTRIDLLEETQYSSEEKEESANSVQLNGHAFFGNQKTNSQPNSSTLKPKDIIEEELKDPSFKKNLSAK